MTTLYTSDLHLGHVNILQYAPQRYDYLDLKYDATVVDMNDAIVNLWNDQVTDDDTVVVIGDVAMGKVHETIKWVPQMRGHKILIPGNHDRIHPLARGSKGPEWDAMYADAGFEVMGGDGAPLLWDFGGLFATVSHFPYYGDHSTDRYNAEQISRYVPADHGLPLVHGHVHDLWQTRDMMYNVGIDAWDGVFQTAEDICSYFLPDVT